MKDVSTGEALQKALREGREEIVITNPKSGREVMVTTYDFKNLSKHALLGTLAVLGGGKSSIKPMAKVIGGRASRAAMLAAGPGSGSSILMTILVVGLGVGLALSLAGYELLIERAVSDGGKGSFRIALHRKKVSEEPGDVTSGVECETQEC